MIIVMKPDATKENIQKVEERLHQVGLKAHLSTGEDCTIIGVIGDRKKIANLEVSMLEGVEKTVRITEKYKLVSRHFHPEDTIVDVDGVKIGGKEVVVMAGPCSVESIEQLREAAKAVKAGGAKFLRGGAFKPRTSPYDFQGLAEEGLKMLREVADEEGLKVVTEIVDKDDIELVGKYADVYQVGARNMQNFQLLKALGKAKKPVMLKRGLAATISEWLNAAEYIMAGGNEQVIFCERRRGHQGTLAPADHRRPEPRHGPLGDGPPDGARRCRRWLRRPDYRGAPASRSRALRWRPEPHAEELQCPDG